LPRILAAILLLLAAALTLWWHQDDDLSRAHAVPGAATPAHPTPQPTIATPAGDTVDGAIVEAPYAAASAPPAPEPTPGETPLHWRLGGNAPEAYALTIDRSTVWNGSASAMLASIAPDTSPYSFGALVQTVSAAPFRNKRIELSAFLKTEGVLAGAALWIRAESAEGMVVAFDNMNVRMIRKTTPWTRHAIVIDIPPEADVIAFGGLLNGRGRFWIDDMQMTEADSAAAAPARQMPRLQVARPRSVDQPPVLEKLANLDFEALAP
jgi:hypothetical protein